MKNNISQKEINQILKILDLFTKFNVEPSTENKKSADIDKRKPRKIKDIKSNDDSKIKILEIFMKNIKNKKIILDKKHHGSEGHWLEKQFGLESNNRNEPDLFGYELKKYSPKITFGDFSASEYLFSKMNKKIQEINNWKDKISISRNDFLKYFGSPNELKNLRYSWSGKSFPKYGKWNDNGQILEFNENNDLCIYYDFRNDRRQPNFILECLKSNKILIAIWKFDKLKKHINRKFNQKGFFICKKEKGVYNKIYFGKRFNINDFIKGIKNNKIILDSGMYEGNNRNYSQFRATFNNFWDMMIIEEY